MKAYEISTSPDLLGDLIHSEYDPTFTTDKGVLLAGSGGVRKVPFAGLVAAIMLGSATVTVGAVVGTGNGVPASATADAGALAGRYWGVIIEPATNGGVFQVIRPDGVLDGTGQIGVAFNGMVNFTWPDGSTDLVAGDRVPIDVVYAAGSEKIVQWDPSAVNGAQTIKGINLFAAEAEDGVDGEITFLARGPVIVRRETIAWHSGVTSDQKKAAYAALKVLGIEPRETG